MQRTALWLVLAVLGFATAPACRDPFGVDDVLGIWNTTSINGYSVPGTVVYEGVSHDTQYVRWAFYEGGQCTLTQQVDGETETFDDCAYTVDLATQTVSVILLLETWVGGIDGNNMTVTDPQDIVWVLTRQ